jgi:hypothetical protein
VYVKSSFYDDGEGELRESCRRLRDETDAKAEEIGGTWIRRVGGED